MDEKMWRYGCLFCRTGAEATIAGYINVSCGCPSNCLISSRNDFLELFCSIKVLNEQYRSLIFAVITIAKDNSPTIVIHSTNLCALENIGVIHHWRRENMTNVFVV